MYYPFAPTIPVLPTRTKLIVPVFEVAVDWNDISELLLRYPIENDLALSIKLPVREVNATFILAIAWADDDDQFRYVFWPGDTLLFPTYNGERIGASAYIEVWSAADITAANDSTITLEASWLNIPDDSQGFIPATLPDIQQILVSEDFTTLAAGAEGNPFAFPYIT